MVLSSFEDKFWENENEINSSILWQKMVGKNIIFVSKFPEKLSALEGAQNSDFKLTH